MVAVVAGPLEMLELSRYWSEKKSDEKPHTRHQKKEALRVREDYLGATYGWNALERVDPNFSGGAPFFSHSHARSRAVRCPSLTSPILYSLP
jgi:hypothetical protein